MSSVQSIDRAFAVLDALASGPAGVTEIAERVGLPKSTVSRLLSTLEGLDAVEQIAVGGDYRLGPTLGRLAATAQPGRSLVAVARPHLLELERLTGEATGLSIPDGTEMLYLDQVTPDTELQVRDWTGHRIPMHAVPSGHVVLAADDDLAARILAGPLEAFTTHTLVKPEALRRRLADVREHGYAVASEEYAADLNSIAAPVRSATGRVVAAIHVYGPATRFPGERDASTIGALVRDTANRITIG